MICLLNRTIFSQTIDLIAQIMKIVLHLLRFMNNQYRIQKRIRRLRMKKKKN